MAERAIPYRLPLAGWPRAVVVTDYGWRGAELRIGDTVVLRARDRGALEEGVHGHCDALGVDLRMRLDPPDAAFDDEPALELLAGGEAAVPEDTLRPRIAPSAWVHAAIAGLGSVAGLAASALYWLDARTLDDAWALKMAVHMAAWHLLLVLTLAPASLWGGRTGIRAVQLVSLVFFAIHLGIALANAGDLPTDPVRIGIAILNALSGAAFLAAVVQGGAAHRDMAPDRALPPRPPAA